jgi:hypothetical protein
VKYPINTWLAAYAVTITLALLLILAFRSGHRNGVADTTERLRSTVNDHRSGALIDSVLLAFPEL